MGKLGAIKTNMPLASQCPGSAQSAAAQMPRDCWPSKPVTVSFIALHDAIAVAQRECSFGWAAQVFKCSAEHGKSSPLVAGAPVEVEPHELLLALQMQQQATFDAVPLDPRTYRR